MLLPYIYVYIYIYIYIYIYTLTPKAKKSITPSSTYRVEPFGSLNTGPYINPILDGQSRHEAIKLNLDMLFAGIVCMYLRSNFCVHG